MGAEPTCLYLESSLMDGCMPLLRSPSQELLVGAVVRTHQVLAAHVMGRAAPLPWSTPTPCCTAQACWQAAQPW
jgi:hypothetical protein